MRISRIELTNYGPFRGLHTIDLASTGVDVFAVTARHESDEERSNWSGKSYFVHSIPLVLFDEYPSKLADGWITRGETEAKIEFRFGDGTGIRRTRIAGRSTQLTMGASFLSKGEASGEHAQQAIVEALGIDKKDLFATSFIRQKQVNRFVSATPSERLAIVSEWLGLEKLRKCRELAGQKFNAAFKEAGKYSVELPTDLRARFDRDVNDELFPEATSDDLLQVAEEERSILAHTVEQCERHVAGLKAKAELEEVEERRIIALATRAREYDSLVVDGKAVQARLKSLVKPKPEAVTAAKAERDAAMVGLREASTACETAAKLARGEFDGVCPVSRRGCPVADDLRSDLASGRAQHVEARARLVEATTTKARKESILSELEIQAGTVESLEGSLKRTADRARPLKAARQELDRMTAESPTEAKAKVALEAARELLDEHRTSLRDVERWVADWKAYQARVAQVREKGEAAKLALELAADEVEVFYRAEREIGQATLQEVEQLANKLLAGAEIDLSVTMTWGRETGQLEASCHRCGAQYPRGRGVKECQECGAKRGPKIEERLDLVTSEESDGAAEDLAGLAVQLAAAAWHRAERGSRFNVLVLDEVTASLDRAHRRTVGRVLAQMIRDAGFEQAFVISHSPDVVESLPGCIEIVVGKDGSRRIEVR